MAIQIGNDWFYVQPDGTRLGPFPDEATALATGTGTVAPSSGTPSGNAPATFPGPGNYTLGGGPTGTGDAVPSGFVRAPNGQYLAPHYDILGNVTGYTPLASSEELFRQAEIAKLQAEAARIGAGAAGTNAQAALVGHQLASQTAAQQLAEQQRQFNETFGSNKAKFNEQQQLAQQQLAQQAAQAQAQRDFTAQQNQLARDQQTQQTLLGLGSRPDTLIRYLYALRGQMAPQGTGTSPAVSAPSGAAHVSPIIEPPVVPSVTPPTPQVAPALTPQNNTVAGIDLSGAHDPRAMTAPTIGVVSGPTSAPGTIYSPGGARGTFTPGTGYGQGGMSFTGIQTSAPGNPAFRSVAQMLASYDPNKPDPNDLVLDPSDRGFARGGVIPEPVMGVGMMSGRMYTFNEDPSRPETVVPQGKTLADVKDRRPARSPDVEDRDQLPDLNIGPPPPPVEYATHGDEVHPMMPMYVPGMPMQRGGGPYIPSIVAPNGFFAPPSHEMQTYAAGGTIGIDPSVFNPRVVSNTFDFPQISNLTGGTSLIPSAQRLFDALPSERNLFSGYLRDEAGVQPEDVFDLARKLAPQATNLRAGRFVN